MQEQRDVQPGPRGAVPLRLPLWLQGKAGDPAPATQGRSALRPADPPSPQGSLGNSMAQVTPEQHLPVTLPRYCWGLPSCVILTPLTEDPTDKEEV